MEKNGNRALAGTRDAADRNAKRQSVPFSLNRARNKAPTADSSRHLIQAARQIEVVHHWSVIGGETWLIVFRAGKRKQTVATYETKREAIEQLGLFSQKLRARVVGRGSAVLR